MFIVQHPDGDWLHACMHACNCTVSEIFSETDFVRIRKRAHFRSLFTPYYVRILYCVKKSVICNVEHPIISSFHIKIYAICITNEVQNERKTKELRKTEKSCVRNRNECVPCNILYATKHKQTRLRFWMFQCIPMILVRHSFIQSFANWARKHNHK